jgi:uncharacterized repeat protein (TIGR01451 family)
MNGNDPWRQAWRFAIIALGVLILCSCRAPAKAPCDMATSQSPAYAGLPPEAYTGVPMDPACAMAGPMGMEPSVPVPYCPVGPWTPPGIAGPWPQDEYVCDGGDAGPPVKVGRQGEIHGLEMEDAVAEFKTVDGRTIVQPSNRVCLYAPRFGAVRQVTNAVADGQRERAAGVSLPTRLAAPRLSQPVGTDQQNVQPIGQLAARPAEILRTKWGRDVVSSRLGPVGFDNTFHVYENSTAIRQGMLVESEAAFLARGVNAAVAWTNTQAVQVILDRRAAMAETGTNKLHTVYTVGAPPGNPRLRLIKVASTPFAEPGDEVSFTLRFDNLGNQPLGSVTIVDSLNTRLEYIPDSAQCSVDAKFSTQANEGDSVVVRCEISNPVQPGKGGIIRFRCRAR